MGRPRKNRRDLPARVYFKTDTYYFQPASGAQVNLGKDLGQALSAYAKLVTDRSPLTTLDTVMDRYLREIVPMKAPRTQRDNRTELANLREAFGLFHADEVTAQDIYRYLDARSQEAPVRANREIALLSHVFKKAIRWGAASRNPCTRTEIERNPEVPRDRYIEDKELQIFRSHASPMIQAYVDFKMLTGMRKGDILTLTRAALQDDGIHYIARKTRGKVGKRRVIEWSPELREAVERIKALRQRRRRRIKGKRIPLVESVFLFATLNGQPYYNTDKAKADGFDAIWKRYMKKAKDAAQEEGWTLEHFTEHDIRAKSGSDAEAADQQGSKLLGNTEKQFRRAYDRGVEKVQPLHRPQGIAKN